MSIGGSQVGAAQTAASFLGFPSDRYFVGPGAVYDNTLTFTVAANTFYTMPFEIPPGASAVLTALWAVVTTLAAGNMRIGLYGNHGNYNQPGSLILDAGQASTGATGALEVAASITLGPGKYWLAAVFSATPTMRSFVDTVYQAIYGAGNSSITGIATVQGYTATQTFGALPSTFPTTLTQRVGVQLPLLGFKT